MTHGMLPYEDMSHYDWLQMRAKPGADQALLAPLEHRAYVREFAAENPVTAMATMPVAIPGYMAAKALGLTKARSPASLDELFAGFHGMFEGVSKGPQWHVVDTRTGESVGRYASHTQASVQAEARNQSGERRYAVKKQ